MTDQPTDSWGTFDPEDQYAGTSLKKRAEKRTVQQVGERKWVVHGDAKMGDAYPNYAVGLKAGERKYECACYGHGRGEHRRRKMCSHVLAVILYRKKKVGESEMPNHPHQPTDWDTEPCDVEKTGSEIVDATERRDAAGRRGGGRDSEATVVEVEPSNRFKSVSADTYPDNPIEMNDDMLGSPPLPKKFVEYRANQWDAIVEVMEHLEAGKKAVMLSAPTGCLAGDTVVTVNRGGGSKRMRIEDLVYKFNGGESSSNKKKWDLSIPTRISQAKGGVMRLATIKSAWVSGMKVTFEVTTESGRTVQATATHPFLLESDTPDVDSWVRLGALEIGDRIHVVEGQGRKSKKPKLWYRLVNGLHHHPYAARRGVNPDKGGYSVVMHRLVVEAAMNHVEYDEWVDAHRTGSVDSEWEYLDPEKVAVHHIDHDALNNDLSNLATLTHQEHKQAHGDSNMPNVLYQIGAETITSIMPVGRQQTFDIEVEDSPHNFIANGFVVHNSGKTIIGETVRRLMSGSSVYCCTTKSLQDQIQREFGYAKTIKGRSNYPTRTRPDLTADDCTWTMEKECDWCQPRNACPYRVAKNDAVFAPLPILNIAYFLSETSASVRSDFVGRDLVIVDEADTLEEQLMSNIEVVLGSHTRKSIGVHTLPKKTVPGDWARWLEDEVLPKIGARKAQLRVEGSSLFGDDIKAKRQIRRLDRLIDKIRPLLRESEDGSRRIEDGWVMTGYEGNAKDPTIRFKPIRVDVHARETLWNRGKQFLLMSATLISPAQMAQDLGLKEGEWAVVNLDSTFPVERRPVFVRPVASMTNKTKQEAWPKMASAIEELLDENPGVRILVHTVSYHLTKYLHDNIKSTRTMAYWNSQDRERVLGEFLAVRDAVLLAPSFERGIDLPEEDCSVIVIAKVPWPYLGDKQIAARMYAKGGRVWYAVQTIRAIVQMTGRGMRSKEDFCDAYILDAQFKRLYRENKRLFPKWWRDSLVLSMTDPKNRKMIDAAKSRREGVCDGNGGDGT